MVSIRLWQGPKLRARCLNWETRVITSWEAIRRARRSPPTTRELRDYSSEDPVQMQSAWEKRHQKHGRSRRGPSGGLPAMVLPLLFLHWTHPWGRPFPFRCCFLTLKQMKKKLTREKITFFSVFLGSCENFKWLQSALPAKLTWMANAKPGLGAHSHSPLRRKPHACFLPSSFGPPLFPSFFFPLSFFPPSFLLLFLSLSLSHSPSPRYKKSMIWIEVW